MTYKPPSTCWAANDDHDLGSVSTIAGGMQGQLSQWACKATNIEADGPTTPTQSFDELKAPIPTQWWAIHCKRSRKANHRTGQVGPIITSLTGLSIVTGTQGQPSQQPGGTHHQNNWANHCNWHARPRYYTFKGLYLCNGHQDPPCHWPSGPNHHNITTFTINVQVPWCNKFSLITESR